MTDPVGRITKLSDGPKEGVGLPDRLALFEKHQKEEGDEYGAEVLCRAQEEIARLTTEVSRLEGEVGVAQRAKETLARFNAQHIASVATLRTAMDKAERERGELREHVQADALCPHCGGVEECSDDCEYVRHAEVTGPRMVNARRLLAKGCGTCGGKKTITVYETGGAAIATAPCPSCGDEKAGA